MTKAKKPIGSVPKPSAPSAANAGNLKKAIVLLASNVHFATEEQAEEFAKLVK